MSKALPEFLNQTQADPDTVQQALRMYLSERTDDLTHEEMLAKLRAAATSEEELEQQLKVLERDPTAIEQAALAYFEHEWEDDTQEPPIRAAFEHAKGKLPVVETTILAVAAMYGMYLLTTRGVTKITRTTKRNADGSYEETEEVEAEPFAPIVSAITQLFWQ